MSISTRISALVVGSALALLPGLALPSTASAAESKPIDAVYTATGRDKGWLGGATDAEAPSVRGGSAQHFKNGAIYKSAAGTHFVPAAIYTKYKAVKAEQGMGYPLEDPVATFQGFTQKFENGQIISVGGVHDVVWNNEIEKCRTGRVFCAHKGLRKNRWVVNGRVMYSLDARFGRQGMETPSGEFRINRKVRDMNSSVDGSKMPFSMFFTNEGHAVHFSPFFAENGFQGGSHGCVNARDYAGLQWIFENSAKVGDRVVVLG